MMNSVIFLPKNIQREEGQYNTNISQILCIGFVPFLGFCSDFPVKTILVSEVRKNPAQAFGKQLIIAAVERRAVSWAMLQEVLYIVIC